MPGVSFIRECRSLLVVITKSLAARHVSGLESFDQLCTDGTDVRQTEFENVVIGYMSDSGFKSVILDATVIPDGKTAEQINASIIRTFKEAGDLLDDWRKVTEELHEDDPELQELLDDIPNRSGLRLSKFNKANIMTDTCNTARKLRVMLIAAITQACKEEGTDDEDIKVFIGDCWHHLRCIWVGAGLKHLNTYLTELLPELDDIH